MDGERFNSFINYVSEAFQGMSYELAEIRFNECAKETIKRDKNFSVIVGITGRTCKGRILLDTGESVLKVITEGINGGPVGNIIDTYLCLAEFANMYCGRAVTLINNKYRGSDLRLTPPAVFTGAGMEITTPSIQSAITFYKSVNGLVTLDIGFEGE